MSNKSEILKQFVKNMLNASDLIQGFTDIALDNLGELSDKQRQTVRSLLRSQEPTDPDSAAGIAAVIYILDNWEN